MMRWKVRNNDAAGVAKNSKGDRQLEKLISKLAEKIEEENIIRDADMREHTTFKAGGKAFGTSVKK